MVFVLCCFCCLFGLFQLSHEIFSRPSKLISYNEATHTYRRDRLTTNVLRRSVATEEGTFQLITKMFPIGCSGFSLFNFILKITQNFLFHDLVIFPLDGFLCVFVLVRFVLVFFIIIIILVCSVVVVVVVVFVYLQLSSLGNIFSEYPISACPSSSCLK